MGTLLVSVHRFVVFSGYPNQAIPECRNSGYIISQFLPEGLLCSL